MCYCTECFVDHNFPRWAETMITPGGTHAWHIVRAFHQTGRCVSCGACERACPMDIKMTYLTDKLNYDMHQEYEFEVGASDDAVPPFAAFTLDDKKRFVR
jgi:ferredoxin